MFGGLKRKLAKKLAGREWRAIVRQACPGGKMKPSLKKSAKKVGMEVGRVALVGAIGAVVAFMNSPEAGALVAQIVEDVPKLAWLLPALPLVGRYLQQAWKHREK